MKTVCFIGGAFDLTKRIVTNTPPIITMYEPVDHGLVRNRYTHEATVECRILRYELQLITKKRVHIYEYAGLGEENPDG